MEIRLVFYKIKFNFVLILYLFCDQQEAETYPNVQDKMGVSIKNLENLHSEEKCSS